MTPPAHVCRAFGASGAAVPLAGGEGRAFRIGDVVVKAVHDDVESAWVQEMLAGLDQDGFRIPTPLRTTADQWVEGGWIASVFVPGLQPAAPRWTDIIEWGLRFGEAVSRQPTDGALGLARRTHRWAVADRVAWQEQEVDLSPEAAEVRSAIGRFLDPAPSTERQVIHGDLAGNVFVDTDGCPVILDVSPYLRHPRLAAAIVIADAVLWHGADTSLSSAFAADRTDRDLLGRALIFRLVAEQLAEHPRHGARLDPYRRVLAAIR
ncbi:MAG: aminoglycoside phosphotransferase [Actinomycetota bacterium]